MTPTMWGALATVLAQAVVIIIWGARLTARVEVLERDIKSLKELPNIVARMAERQDMWIEQLKEINSSIRWMREPSSYKRDDFIRPK